MNEFVMFIKENYISIAVIVSIIFVLLLIISIREWDLNPPKPDSKLVQEVVVETFFPDSDNSELTKEITDLKLGSTDSFCQSHLGKSAELETSCSQLTDEGCSQTTCCVLATSSGKNMCKAGDKNGPIFKKDTDGNLISMDAYYYQGKKRDIVRL
jgi:hypothetical protein